MQWVFSRPLAESDFTEAQRWRFWNRVRVVHDWDSCWEWAGPVNAGGYGTLGIGTKKNPRSVLAHRSAYALTKGLAPDALVLHGCDNRRCCRPSHLSLGTHADNSVDMVTRGRSRSSRPGEANPRARLTAEQVGQMRLTYSTLRRGEKTKYRHEMAARHGVSFAAIRAAISGENWPDEWIQNDGVDVVKKAMGV